MKIAVTSKGNTIESQVDPRFGRCGQFIIVESDDMSFEVVDNSAAAAGGGAGIQAAQQVAETDAKILLTGNCGPNAFKTLDAAEVEVVSGVSGTVKDAIEAYKAGTLKPASDANVESHNGMNPAPVVEKKSGMKIAIPVVGGKLSAHFGHCEQFAFVEVDAENKTIVSTELLTPPQHEPGVLPRWTAEQGANLIIGGGMGTRAQDMFTQSGVKVMVGAPTDTPEAIVTAYLNGTLQTGSNACDH